MAHGGDDYIKEQERRHKELVELKLAQQSGEALPADPKVDMTPKTFKEKAVNFWYHYKFATILTVFSAVVLAVLVYQCAGRVPYDCEVVVYLNSYVSTEAQDALKSALEKNCPDVNGDGKVNVAVIDCSVYDDMNPQFRMTQQQRFQVQLVSPEKIIYILDNDTAEYVESVAEGFISDSGLPELDGRGLALAGTDAGKALKDYFDEEQLNGIYMTLRQIDGTAVGKQVKKEIVEAAKTVVDKAAQSRAEQDGSNH